LRQPKVGGVVKLFADGRGQLGLCGFVGKIEGMRNDVGRPVGIRGHVAERVEDGFVRTGDLFLIKINNVIVARRPTIHRIAKHRRIASRCGRGVQTQHDGRHGHGTNRARCNTTWCGRRTRWGVEI